MKIIFLWAEPGSYLDSLANKLYDNIHDLVDIIHWEQLGNRSGLYYIQESSKVKYYSRSLFTDKKLFEFISERKPSIIVVSGWMDKGYLEVCKKYKREFDVKIVCTIDDQWKGSLRQYFGRYFYQIFYNKRIFDYMWVAGMAQTYYAAKFNIKPSYIIPYLLSGSDLFETTTVNFSRRFVFVGRFDRVKDIQLLIRAHKLINTEQRKLWPLTLIGDGELKEQILSEIDDYIYVLPKMQPESLKSELLKGGVGCYTSYHEPFGVVVHEYTKMGMPLLLSSVVGAGPEFLINGYNGYIFEAKNLNSLFNRMNQFISLDDNKLDLFSKNSHNLSKRISSEMSANALISISL
jgi:glycosyltransferase involved in cell wall biosynthesis